MLLKEVVKLLNEQINKEMYASNLYLSMSSWCYENSLDGAGLFLFNHASEESEHAKRLITYLNETDSHVDLREVKQPEQNFSSLLDVFEKTFEHEQFITNSINFLVEQMLHYKDYSTFNFLQWYVSEQHEEEALFRGIVDKIKLIGNNGNGLYLADQYIKNLAQAKK
ncbi:ferritin [Campylobacter novaezeelandiae]|uniref:Ferritin n=1 Tax=Campylobacter novaezeelandiae TaxID=2267891 RepID=A0A4Q9JTG6_9BACT|nr:ferritin [Campylobacter novaezeelandiae]MBK1963942.1 ferritin [Campylobacter novaezeelandiae]MBK1993644.1 ferritin [Campylobacter novaezeelandiae]QWU80215.1 ferritin [Campylobacter novaezeelandiae]TBR79990.1 ferritin [Campylobacter novaezeelandiae]TBR80275.1 ferritin [Campylobacter novaezeelandiae]